MNECKWNKIHQRERDDKIIVHNLYTTDGAIALQLQNKVI